MQSREGLIVRDLAVERGGRPLLAGVTFTVSPGTALAVTGANGVGKSTLLRALAGLLKPTNGSVALHLSGTGLDRDGADEKTFSSAGKKRPEGPDELARNGVPVAERAQYLGHANGLKAALSAAENLRFAQRWLGGGGQTPSGALDAVGLRHCADVPTGLLSAGQKRRVALAGLLVAPRPLWLLDEPATALDHGSEAILVRLIGDQLARGGIAVMALHAPLDIPVTTLRLGRA